MTTPQERFKELTGDAPHASGRGQSTTGDTPQRTRPRKRAENTLPGYENDKIAYPNAAALSRPLDMPKQVRAGLAAFLVVAALIGAYMLYNYFDSVVNAPVREQAALEERLATDVAYNMPAIAPLMALDDETIMATLAETNVLYERIPIGSEPSGGFDVVRLPDGLTVAEADAMYTSGISNLSGSDAARLLNGSWDLMVSRENGVTDIRVRYADFKSGTVEAAVQNALEIEGLAELEITDSGVDDAGNTYAAGTIESDGATYSWRVSALPLSEVYKIKGFPESALYVGVRFTAA